MPIAAVIVMIVLTVLAYLIPPDSGKKRGLTWFIVRTSFAIFLNASIVIGVLASRHDTERITMSGTITQMKDVVVKKTTQTQLVLDDKTVKYVTVTDGAVLKTGQSITLSCFKNTDNPTSLCKIE